MPPLLEGVSYQTHAPQLPDDEQSRNVGLEILTDAGNVHPSPLGAEYELDGLHRAGTLAEAVTDTVGRGHRHRLAAPDSQDILFGANGKAAPGTDAQIGIDDRMEGGRDVEAFLFRASLCLGGPSLPASLHDNEGENGRHDQGQTDEPDR